jgi:hypothetical protein
MPEFNISLSRTGGQGSKGDSVVGANIDANGDFIFTVLKSDGTTEDFNAGSLDENFNIDQISDITLTNPQEGDVLIYDATGSDFKNHQLTTSKLLDVDNSGKEDGAVLVYDNTSSKYKATNRIEKETTHIIGGSF